jgi:steroid 5-alpha reductase family enzyme
VSALVVNLWIAGAVTAACWIASVATREYSWVDRLWSVVPVVYLWVFAAHAHDARVTLMAVLVTCWGVRLTVNFARRGGYAPGGEDYRWGVLRRQLPGWRFQVFNLLFIAIYQNALLLLITLPAWTASQHPRPLGGGDAIAAAVFAVLLVGETVADQQRWDFHRSGRAAGGATLRTGLYGFSRHPNYVCELGQWWVVFAFGALAAGTVWLPTVAGAVLLIALFVGSARFTEQISASHHPDFEDYRRAVPMFVGLPRRAAARQVA